MIERTRTTKIKLGYAFAPIPGHVVDDFLAGALNEHQARLILFLYRRASYNRLSSRVAAVRLTAATKITQTRWPYTEASFTRMLSRLRSTGRYFYQVDRKGDLSCTCVRAHS
jgi:hypothetical protein